MVSTRVRWSGVAAIAFGVSTAPLMVMIGAVFGVTSRYTLSIPLSAIVTGGIVWFVVVELWYTNPVTRGVIAGVLTGLLSYFVYWPLTNLWEPQFFYESLLGTTVGAIFSILWFGWFSVPLGLIAGLGVGYLRKQNE